MARKSLEKQMEAETIIRWDETDDLAILWTASAPVRQEWESFGFPVKISEGSIRGWESRVPKDRISYKTLRKQTRK